MCRFPPTATQWPTGQPIHDSFDDGLGIVAPLPDDRNPEHLRAWWVTGSMPSLQILTLADRVTAVWMGDPRV